LPHPALSPAFQLGEPVRARGIAVAPLFPRAAPIARYITLDEALSLGLRVTEVDAAGAVPELRVVNPTDRRVLLYDGEELVGAKQNRILNVSVLIEAGASLAIPVSCVEQGRWHDEGAMFLAADHASHPELRRRKAERLAGAPLARGAAQGEVWDEVAGKASRLGVRSRTGAHRDTYAERRVDLAALAARFPLQSGQCGAVLALAGAPVCLDLVSRPEAFARLYPKLLAGYLLDAIEHLDAPDASETAIAGFVGATLAASVRPGPAVGLGEDLRLAGATVLGSGLALDGELIQLSAYARRGDARRARPIARPSRRLGR
jgi:hypothetical protein